MKYLFTIILLISFFNLSNAEVSKYDSLDISFRPNTSSFKTETFYDNWSPICTLLDSSDSFIANAFISYAFYEQHHQVNVQVSLNEFKTKVIEVTYSKPLEKKQLLIAGLKFRQKETIRQLYQKKLDSTLTAHEKLKVSFQRLGYDLKRPFIYQSNDISSLVYKLKPKQKNQIDLLAAYGTESNKGVYGQGQVNLLGVLNPLDEFSLEFERLRKRTQSYQIAYQSKLWFNHYMPVGQQLSVQQQDTLYQSFDYEMNLAYPLSRSKKLLLTAKINRTQTKSMAYSTSTFGTDGKHKINKIGLGYRYSNKLNDQDLFNDFSEYEVIAYYGKKSFEAFEQKRIKGDWYELKTNFRIQHQLGDRIYFNTHFSARYLETEANLSPGDLISVGGLNAVRGYAENTLMSDNYVWSKFEVRYQLADLSMAYLFTDVGYTQIRQQISEVETLDSNNLRNDQLILNLNRQIKSLTGYGFGFKYQTTLGVFNFSYALSELAPFSNPRIHMGFMSQF